MIRACGRRSDELEEIELEHIARVVSRTSSFEAAAKSLGIDATTLQRKRKRYGLA
ncbi:MAG TPA: helix-turn-helix domain-containing protein [Gemmataceae bacterium]|nr:helix-turn-helix domain-containing protein [Gemmataceae bacterium]